MALLEGALLLLGLKCQPGIQCNPGKEYIAMHHYGRVLVRFSHHSVAPCCHSDGLDLSEHIFSAYGW